MRGDFVRHVLVGLARTGPAFRSTFRPTGSGFPGQLLAGLARTTPAFQAVSVAGPTPNTPATRVSELMARITIKTVAVHQGDADSICEHPTAPTGKPRDPKTCPGRAGYRVHCSACGGLTGERHGIRSNADDARDRHRDTHAAAPAAH
jgi:hypothetical protein